MLKYELKDKSTHRIVKFLQKGNIELGIRVSLLSDKSLKKRKANLFCNLLGLLVNNSGAKEFEAGQEGKYTYRKDTFCNWSEISSAEQFNFSG